jgi:hypothetical protein
MGFISDWNASEGYNIYITCMEGIDIINFLFDVYIFILNDF